MIAFMYARASRYYGQLRRAAGMRWYIPGQGSGEASSPNTAELDLLLPQPRAMELATVGAIGLLAIVWLMVLKPF
jgi:hypothetical protein